MGKESFYKLKLRKQEKILNAIRECLVKYDYDNLTIFNIVEEAEISRGSFYDYFVDKKDAIDTFVLDYIRNMIVRFTNIIEKNHYKLFDGILDAYTVITKELTNEIYFNIMKNIKYFSDFANGIIFSKNFIERYDLVVDWMMENTYEAKNKLLNKKEIRTILDLTLSVLSQSLFRYLIGIDKKEIEKDYINKINIIKNGIHNKKVEV